MQNSKIIKTYATPMIIIKSEIRKLQQKVKILKDLRHIRNEILSNCAYHNKNLEEQISRLEKLNTPKNEIDLIKRSNNLSFKYSHELIGEYNNLLDLLENNFDNKVIGKSIKDIKKGDLINVINNL